ncbi:DUF2776 family protein [Escherichia coli]|nr:DUF2776 family protein [Escherichia coli]
MNIYIGWLFKLIPLIMGLICIALGGFVLESSGQSEYFVAGHVLISLAAICLALFTTALIIISQLTRGVNTFYNTLFPIIGYAGAVLQISSYWQPGEFVSINLLPDVDLETFLNEQRNAHPNQSLKNTLAVHLPKRLVERLQQLGQIPDVSLKQLNVRDQQALISTLTDWRVQPNGTEGYRTAEVTLGGVDTNELSSRTMEARKVPGLYFIGEVMDVTGWLGGYNFQWAWSSAWACAQDLIAV